MNFAFNAASLAVSLPIMLKGLMGIFAVIVVIWALVVVLNRVTGRKKNQD